MNDWKNKYPYTLDKALIEAIKIAEKEYDSEMVRDIWKIFVSYRKSTYEK